MDRNSVEKMKLTRFGLKLNLVAFSSFLSVLGILVSIIGIAGCIAAFLHAILTENGGDETYSKNWICGLAISVFIILVPYLSMWIRLKIKTNKRDITGIERILETFGHVTGVLEIIGTIVGLWHSYGISFIYHIFACLKVVGIRDEDKNSLGAYLGFCYTLSFTYMMFFVGFIVYLMLPAPGGPLQLTFFLTAGGYFLLVLLIFILQTGPIVLLHGIRGNRQSSAETEEENTNKSIEI